MTGWRRRGVMGRRFGGRARARSSADVASDGGPHLPVVRRRSVLIPGCALLFVAASFLVPALPAAGAGTTPQVINFTNTPPSPLYVNGTYLVTTDGGGGSGNPVTLSVDLSSTSGCTIDLTGDVTLLAPAGTCVIDANQAGDATYDDAAQVQQSVSDTTTPQTIQFTNTPPSPLYVNDTYEVTTDSGGGSGLPVVLSVDLSSTSGCTIDPSTGDVTLSAPAGTCVIDANQAGNAAYSAAQVQQSVSDTTTPQVINFTNTPPSPLHVNGTYAVTTDGGGSGNPVTLSVDLSSTSGCTIDPSTGDVTLSAPAGTCVIDANQAGDAAYAAAAQVQQSVSDTTQSQTIHFTNTPPSPLHVNATYVVTATGGGSGNPVVLSVDLSSTSGCTIDPSTGDVTLSAPAGTCVIDANQVGNAAYAAAAQVQQSVADSLSAQVINFTSSVPSSPTVGGTYVVSATGGVSGNPVTFSIDATSTAGACSITGPTVSLIGAGTCVIDANQAGNNIYSAAPEVRQSFGVPPGSQLITFTSSVPSSPIVGGTYTVSATGGASGNPVTFSIDVTSTPGACSITGPTVSLTGAGTCVIDANQTGNTNYEAAPEVQQSFGVTLSGQVITFTSSVPSSPTVGRTYVVSATGGVSGNPVTFSIDATSTAGACSITGPTVSLIGAGTCVIDANQAGNNIYSAAPEVQQSFGVLPGSQFITFTSSVPSSPTVGGIYTVSATGGASGNPVTYSIDAASTAGACSNTGPAVSLTGVGTCVVDANQAGDADYLSAPEAQQSFSIAAGGGSGPTPPGGQVITFTSSVPSSPIVGGTYTVSATGGASGNPVTFSIDVTSTPGACLITGPAVSLTGVGTCVVDANQAGNANLKAAPEVQQSFSIVLGGQAITFTSSVPSSAKVGETYVVSATGGASGNPVTFSIAKSSAGACTINKTTVSLTGVGTCVIDANQAASASYAAAPEVHQSFVVRSAISRGPPPKPVPKIVINLDTFTRTGRTIHESVKLSCIRATCTGQLRSLGVITTSNWVRVKTGPWTITKKVTTTFNVVLTSAPYRLAKGKSVVLTLAVSAQGRSAFDKANAKTPLHETLTATVEGGLMATKSTSVH